MQSLDITFTQEKENTYKSNTPEKNSFLDSQSSGVWIFGYGSLIWNANFKYSKSLIGYINGHVRRFWQGSTDHRGVPGKPGRVATLIPTDSEKVNIVKKDIVWGRAYYVPSTYMEESFSILNYREKGGYSQEIFDFYPRENEETKIPVVVYNAVEGNEDYLGDASIDDIAKQISEAVGPSGSNKDYLYTLGKTLTELNIATEDDILHTIELVKRVEKLNEWI